MVQLKMMCTFPFCFSFASFCLLTPHIISGFPSSYSPHTTQYHCHSEELARPVYFMTLSSNALLLAHIGARGNQAVGTLCQSGTYRDEGPYLSYYSLLHISGDSGPVSKLAKVHRQLAKTMLILPSTYL